MAPEQLEGKEADHRTDIFAFGAVVYEMATGRRAFAGTSQASLITAIMSSEPPPLKTLQPVAPPALERIVGKCLEKDPERRWQTARDLADELEWISTTSDPRAWRRQRRRTSHCRTVGVGSRGNPRAGRAGARLSPDAAARRCPARGRAVHPDAPADVKPRARDSQRDHDLAGSLTGRPLSRPGRGLGWA